MKKIAKSLLSLILCLTMVMGLLVPSFAAGTTKAGLTLSSGLNTLKAEWSKNFSSVTGVTIPLGMFGLTNSEPVAVGYNYYNPRVINDTKKYPVVVFIGREGMDEVNSTSYALWLSKEYQSRFANIGGAHLLMFKNLPSISNNWPYRPAELLGKAVNTAVNQYITDPDIKKYVDTDRIYIVAWDSGCEIAMKAIAGDKDDFGIYYSAAALFSPKSTYIPSEAECNKAASATIWYTYCKADGNAAEKATEFWDQNLANASNEYIYKYRCASFDTFRDKTTSSDNHKTWEAGAYDFGDLSESGFISSGLYIQNLHYSAKTSSYDRIILGKDEGLISWLSGFNKNGPSCDCACHGATGMKAILWSLKIFISMVFQIQKNRECACGRSHW